MNRVSGLAKVALSRRRCRLNERAMFGGLRSGCRWWRVASLLLWWCRKLDCLLDFSALWHGRSWPQPHRFAESCFFAEPAGYDVGYDSLLTFGLSASVGLSQLLGRHWRFKTSWSRGSCSNATKASSSLFLVRRRRAAGARYCGANCAVLQLGARVLTINALL